ncbi:MAG: putative bifunctional diguanylate cyclase/phosphodiesterase [Frankiaceae bacterium]
MSLSASAEAGSETREAPTPHWGLWVLIATLAAAAVALWIPLVGVPVPRSDVWPGVALLAAFVIAESIEIHVEFRRQSFITTGSDAVLVVGLFFVAPLVLLIARVGGGALVALARRWDPLKILFNLALFATETGLAALLFRTLAPSDLSGPQTWLPTYAAMLPSQLLGTLSVLLAISFAQARPSTVDLLSIVPAVFVGGPFEVTLGLLAVDLLQRQPWAMLLLAVLATVLAAALRRHAALARRHATLNEVYDFTRSVVAAHNGHDVLALLLREACRMTHASAAAVHLVKDRPSEWPSTLALTTEQEDAPHSQRIGPAHKGETRLVNWPVDPLRDRVLAGESMVLPRDTQDAHKRAWLTVRNVPDALLVPLTDTREVVGCLEIVDRLGNAASFTDDDRRLAETLAAQVAVAYDNSRLLDRSIYDATHDPLTGLPNRALFLARTREELQRARDAATGPVPLAVVVVDMDRFKDINETLGHQSGDGVLQRAALRLRHAVPPGSTLARIGGDEFGVLVADPCAAAEALARVEDLRLVMQEPLRLDELTIEAGASYGLAIGPAPGVDAEGLLQRADIALHAAKEDPGSVEAWRPALDRASPRRLALVGELRRALERGDLQMAYQPKVVLSEGEVVGVEALVRWPHPELGMLSPDDFVPLAERTGLMRPLTAVVLRVALAQCRKWLDLDRRMGVAVNLSVRGLVDPQLPAMVATLLEDTGVPPEALTIEITETTVMSDVARTLPLLQRLADLGVALSVDDFGTGYSSLAYLRRLPVHEIKIDKSFVQDMGTDPSDAAIVQTIIGLAHNLGLRVVAEGVEDERSRELLVRSGCDLAQGYLISRPLSPDRLEAWLSAGAVRAARSLRTEPRRATRL